MLRTVSSLLSVAAIVLVSACDRPNANEPDGVLSDEEAQIVYQTTISTLPFDEVGWTFYGDVPFVDDPASPIERDRLVCFAAKPPGPIRAFAVFGGFNGDRFILLEIQDRAQERCRAIGLEVRNPLAGGPL